MVLHSTSEDRDPDSAVIGLRLCHESIRCLDNYDISVALAALSEEHQNDDMAP